LAGPSSAIAGSVTTGFPHGTRLVSVVTHATGTYDVALSAQALSATDLQRQSLSAQVVWTLRGLDPRFRGVRITAGSQPLKVPGVGDLQTPEDWDVFDPEGLSAGPAYFVAGQRVQSLTGGRRAAGPNATRDLPVQSVAVSPDRTQIAVLRAGVVRRGQIGARSLPPAPAHAPAGLRSASWGTGTRGLWLLDGRGRVLLLDAHDRFRVASIPGVEGRVSWVAVSRDGVRAALVIKGALYVGRVTPAGEPVAIVGATRIASEISAVTRVAWRDPTDLVVLGALSQTPVLPVLVAVDGSTVRPLPVAGLPARAEEVAASSLGVLVTADGKLFQLSSLGFRPGPSGGAPAYPG
ncbi:MAG: Lipoprotein LpqB, beta-propeller domain-like protein, partial [Frankiales bacterium]|nr:Lipoprotein LpqB, beta-propeller domain-like protein [Frankiales bacterium]